MRHTVGIAIILSLLVTNRSVPQFVQKTFLRDWRPRDVASSPTVQQELQERLAKLKDITAWIDCSLMSYISTADKVYCGQHEVTLRGINFVHRTPCYTRRRTPADTGYLTRTFSTCPTTHQTSRKYKAHAQSGPRPDTHAASMGVIIYT